MLFFKYIIFLTDVMSYLIIKKQYYIYSSSQYEILCKTSQPIKLTLIKHSATLVNTNDRNHCIRNKTPSHEQIQPYSTPRQTKKDRLHPECNRP